MLLVPLSAHALFARPLVVGADSVLAVEVARRTSAPGCCGATAGGHVDLPPGARDRGAPRSEPRAAGPAARSAPFTDRLVAKFDLPVDGLAGRGNRP